MGQAPQAPDDFTPAWARHAVWYQILPERFCNGDPGNDPDRASLHNEQLAPHWQVHPWTSDWYRLQPWERDGARPRAWHLADRRYGGDLAGIIAKLDYLQDLGVNALYLNPVFDAPSWQGSSRRTPAPGNGARPTG